jgi:hypothetical protein
MPGGFGSGPFGSFPFGNQAGGPTAVVSMIGSATVVARPGAQLHATCAISASSSVYGIAVQTRPPRPAPPPIFVPVIEIAETEVELRRVPLPPYEPHYVIIKKT